MYFCENDINRFGQQSLTKWVVIYKNQLIDMTMISILRTLEMEPKLWLFLGYVKSWIIKYLFIHSFFNTWSLTVYKFPLYPVIFRVTGCGFYLFSFLIHFLSPFSNNLCVTQQLTSHPFGNGWRMGVRALAWNLLWRSFILMKVNNYLLNACEVSHSLIIIDSFMSTLYL